MKNIMGNFSVLFCPNGKGNLRHQLQKAIHWLKDHYHLKQHFQLVCHKNF